MYEVDKNTVSLLHFDDVFKDETGKVWTTNGNPTISATQSKVGGKSLYLDGSSYLITENNTDFDFGNGDFTIDWWEYRTTSSISSVYTRNNSVLGGSLVVGQYNGGNIVYYMSSDGSSWNIANRVTMGTAILNEWTHYALVRKGTSIMAFQNGVLKSTITSNASILKGLSTPLIGYDASNYYKGYIDEFRISNVARWTDVFNPEPVVNGNELLRITMIDSSEREYRLTDTEVNGFVNWYNHHVSTDTMSYAINDSVDRSKEYLSFDKIISFKVIPTVE